MNNQESNILIDHGTINPPARDWSCSHSRSLNKRKNDKAKEAAREIDVLRMVEVILGSFLEEESPTNLKRDFWFVMMIESKKLRKLQNSHFFNHF